MALVLGAGVSGLTCAVSLLRAGHRVQLWTREPTASTASAVAAAFWYPYHAFPLQRVLRWARASYAAFASMPPAAGVVMRDAIEVSQSEAAIPWWAPAVADLRRARPGELPAGYGHGFAFRAPVIDTRRYLPYLTGLLADGGVTIATRAVTELDEALAVDPLVINCTGLGAGPLTGDRDLHPIRGQLVHVRAPTVDRVIVDEHGPDGIAYVVPRGDDCVLGGTADPGRTDLGPVAAEADAVVRRCQRLCPALTDAPRIADAVGLRPGRSAVRLDKQWHRRPGGGDGAVVHNYGHGGAGVTLSWGCAAEVCSLANERPSVAAAPR